jgi:hypothetical protein
MARPAPRKVILEFDGGVKKESTFDALPEPLQSELLRQPFASLPSADPAKEKFVVVEWDDGWKEVFEVDATCKGVKRYTVITRPEDVGRLAIDREDGLPELIEIIRKPLNVNAVTLVADSADTVKTAVDKSVREGKKVDHFYKVAKSDGSLASLVESFRQAVAAEGVDLAQVKSGDSSALEKIRRRMGVRAGYRQQDAYDFLGYLAKQVVAS